MPKPMIRIYTTADEYIDREMTAAEYKVYQADQAEAETRKAEAEAKVVAKQAILDRIGLTADELQTILG
jgi:F0F1-type ATP synthase membrane subunit b/b'